MHNSNSQTAKENVLFSIIIPCYNGEDYIAEAIQSVLDQSYQNYEIIVVNDGSSDSSQIIIEALQKNHPEKITLINQKNKGLPATRNEALKHSKGDWILLLDADDLFASDRLRVLADKVSQYPDCQFFFHDSYRIDSDGNAENETYIHRKHFYSDIEKFASEKSGADLKLNANYWQFILCEYTSLLPITICIKSSLLTALGQPFDEKLEVGEDVDFCVECIKPLDYLIYIDSSLSSYRVHGSSMTHDSKYIIRQTGYYKRMKEKFFSSLDPSYKKSFLEKFSKHYDSLSWMYRKDGKLLKALKYRVLKKYFQFIA